MSISACSFTTDDRDSYEAGRRSGEHIRRELSTPPRIVLAYLTTNHDQEALLKGLRAALGPEIPILGCSGQGVMGKGFVREEGYAASLLGLGGDSLRAASAVVEDIQVDTEEKGRLLGKRLRAGSPTPPKCVVMHFDPLAGADVHRFLDAMHAEVECPIVGGASANYFGPPMTATFQYFDERVLSRAAVGLAMWGDFTPIVASTTGCSPLGVDMTVTRAEGNHLIELDGRPAIEVWEGLTGPAKEGQIGNTAALAIGIHPAGAEDGADEIIRAALVLDADRARVTLLSAIPTGTRVSLHHRTVEDVLEGAARVGREIDARREGRAVRAVLGFECGARTRPFLGDDATLKENISLQRVAGPDAAWAGVIVWGEVFPVASRPMAHNYTYPLLAIVE